jgi:hypothetical protein
MLDAEEDEFEAPLRAEVERLRELANAWDRRTPPTALDSRQKGRWQRDAWCGGGVPRCGAASRGRVQSHRGAVCFPNLRSTVVRRVKRVRSLAARARKRLKNAFKAIERARMRGTAERQYFGG